MDEKLFLGLGVTMIIINLINVYQMHKACKKVDSFADEASLLNINIESKLDKKNKN